MNRTDTKTRTLEIMALRKTLPKPIDKRTKTQTKGKKSPAKLFKEANMAT